MLDGGDDTPDAKAAAQQPLVANGAKSPAADAAAKKAGTGGGHGHSHDASQLNMHGVFLHVLGDAFGSIIVIINAIIVWQVDDANVRKYLDPSLRFHPANAVG